MNADALLCVIVPLLPLLAAGVFVFRPRHPAVSLLAAGTALPALLLAMHAPEGTELHWPWLLMGVRLGLDSTARIFLFFTAVVWLLAGLYAVSYVRDPDKRSRFFLYFLPAMSGNFGLILAQDISTFYAFFSLMSFASYGLVVHDRTDYAQRAGRVYIWLVVVGEAMIFAGLLLLAVAASSIHFADLPGALAASPYGKGILGLLLLGFGIKAGALPLHVWLPLAHPAAPSPASAVLSGAMIKAGLLGWIRFLPLGEVALPTWGAVVMGMGLAAALYAVLVGLTQSHPKTVLAYSSISQMGMITLAVGAALAQPKAWSYAWPAILVAATHHAVAKGTLFLSVGIVADASRHIVLRVLRFIGLLVPALVLAGLPFTSGMDAKQALKLAVKGAPEPWAELLLYALPIAAVGTMLLMVRFLWLTRASATRAQARVGVGMALAWLASIGCVLAMPLILRTGTFAAVKLPGLSGEVAWSGAWPVATGCLIGGAFLWVRWPDRLRVPEGDLLALFLALFGGMRRLLPAQAMAVFRRNDSASQAIWRPRPLLYGLSRQVERIEGAIARWPVFGGLFLVGMVLLFALLYSG